MKAGYFEFEETEGKRRGLRRGSLRVPIFNSGQDTFYSMECLELIFAPTESLY